MTRAYIRVCNGYLPTYPLPEIMIVPETGAYAVYVCDRHGNAHRFGDPQPSEPEARDLAHWLTKKIMNDCKSGEIIYAWYYEGV